VSQNDAPAAGQLETGSDCAASGDFAGLFARDAWCSSGCAFPPGGAAAAWVFEAPSGTSITGVRYSRWMYASGDPDWEASSAADGVVLESCSVTYPAPDCSIGVPGGQQAAFDIPGATRLELGVRCRPNAYGDCVRGSTEHDVAAVLYAATVTLTDDSAPTVTNPAGSLLTDSYATGTETADFDASDNTGIRSARVYIDGTAQPATSYACDYTYTVPCANRSAGELTVDTRPLTDGSHAVELAASDPAGNERRTPAHAIVVDNTAPATPSDLTVTGGATWHAQDSFDLTWTNPAGQVAPIAAAHYEVCTPDESTCEPEQRVEAAGIASLSGITVPIPGRWLVRVWLEDAAGNVDRGTAATTELGWGETPATSSPQASPAPAPATSPAVSEPLLSASDGAAGAGALEALSPGPLLPSNSPRRSPLLRLLRVRVKADTVLLVGRTARSATGRVELALRSSGRATIHRTTYVHGGTFRVRIRGRRPPTSVVARYSGNPSFRPARATAHIRG
jgi:hypothetical protein